MNTALIGRSKIGQILEFFFGERASGKSHKKYVKAVECLDRAEYCINNIGIEFPNQDSYSLQLIKNTWVEMDDKDTTGVRKMAIHMGNDYWSLITHIEKGGSINPHIHKTQYEVIKMIEGRMKEMITGKIFERGDVFVIPKGKAHHIVALDDECYIYNLYTEDERNLKLPHQETDFLEKKIHSKDVAA